MRLSSKSRCSPFAVLSLLSLYSSLSLLIPFPFPGIPNAQADSAKIGCPDLEKCVLTVSELTGDKYIYDGDSPRGAVRATENFELNRENAEEVFTRVLDQNGFTRLPLSDPKTYVILRQRDARDSALPTVLADSKTTPEFPKSWDLAALRYKLARPELAEHICRTIRAFMPANSRVVADEVSGQIMLVASYPILANVLRTIQSMDVKGSKPRAEPPRSAPPPSR